MAETPVLEDLEFRYTFSQQDEQYAYGLYDANMQKAALGRLLHIFGIAMCSAVALLVAHANKLELIQSVATGVTGAALGFGLAAFFGVAWRRTKVEPFEPIEIVSSVSERGISNRTPYVFEEIAWAAVRKIECLEYGIVFQTINTRWYVPRSAFASTIQMHVAFKKVRAFKDLYMKPIS